MATISWPENKLKESLVKELVNGQNYATQLQNLLKKSSGVEGFLISSPPSSLYDDLVLKILTSFTQALSLLNTTESFEVCQNLASSQVDSVCCDDRRSQDSGESKKRRLTTVKDRRGCYRRKKTSHSWTKVSPTIEDGYAWRKYGQKEILNAKYPRSYFRCTHKYDQGCKATKQVQKKEDDPNIYLITYIGNHICSDFLKNPQKISTYSNPDWEYSTRHHQISSSTKEETPCDLTDSGFTWKNFITVGDQPEIASTRGAIYHGLDMDSVFKSIVNFDDDTEFNYLG